ncbi:helix-turn-helix domain-containing protein [Clostridium amazonitimonense]|uniref:helix-turn-helix domain-containing protein n=1 Tax=Clostridium amazonitimonense TaxID=1499689 RepID=UPI000509F351|nr:XRE family transcriptional regulator [Clostridium amazonitimonense]
MSFGQNIQFLRKMHKGMTQEELAEKMGVSRQTVSKWELDGTYPEMDKVIELCKLFSCSMDKLVREDINMINEAYSNLRVEEVTSFAFVKYAVISVAPEDDAIKHIKDWANSNGINKPEIIGWDFPYVSQEQINVYNMHGYEAACILPLNFEIGNNNLEVITQKEQHYAIITIKEPFIEPFSLIPNAYKTLMIYMEVNCYKHKKGKDIIHCFEKVYEKDGICYMDVYIAVED